MENKILKDMGVSALNVHDACATNGGLLLEWAGLLKKLTPAAFGIWVVDNWEDVKQGFSDGWNVK